MSDRTHRDNPPGGAPPGSIPSITRHRSDYPKPKMRLLIVEDSPVIRQRLVDMIKHADTVELVGSAENGVQGIEMLIAFQPDAILLDLQMPGLTGFDMLPVIRREKPDCLVIVFTCFADEATRQRCIKLGADYFFDKATEFERIVEVLQTAG